MLIQDRRLMSDRLYANAASKFLAGNKAGALDILKRGFPGSEVADHIRAALGKFYVSPKRGA